MLKTLKPDVLIVGGGIAGCAGALSLTRKGLNVLVVERDAEVRERFKGEYLQPFAARTLRNLGFSEVVDGDDTVKIRQLRFRDLDESNNVISETLVRYPLGSYAAVLPNRDLTAAIRTHAQKMLGEKFLAGATIEPVQGGSKEDFLMSPEFDVKTISGEMIRVKPRWVLGCDGRQSTVRRWMGGAAAPAKGAATIGSKPEFIVGTELKGAHSFSDLYQVIRSENRGTLAIFKLGDDSRRCYWNAPAGEGAGGKKEWESELGSLLKDLSKVNHLDLQADQFSNLAGAPADTTWMGPSARGRFLLTGDALAVTTPFGGQGMTCAMHHILALTDLIDQNSDKTSDDIHILGARYDAIARNWYKHVNLLNFALYYLFFAKGTMYKSTTRHILNHWNNNPEILNRVGRLFGGDDLDTPGVMELVKVWGLMPAKIPFLHGRRSA